MKLKTRKTWLLAFGGLSIVSAAIYARANTDSTPAYASAPAPCLAVDSNSHPLICVAGDPGRFGFTVLRGM